MGDNGWLIIWVTWTVLCTEVGNQTDGCWGGSRSLGFQSGWPEWWVNQHSQFLSAWGNTVFYHSKRKWSYHRKWKREDRNWNRKWFNNSLLRTWHSWERGENMENKERMIAAVGKIWGGLLQDHFGLCLQQVFCSIHSTSFSSSGSNRSTATVKQYSDFPEVWSSSWVCFSSNQMSLATDHCSLGSK